MKIVLLILVFLVLACKNDEGGTTSQVDRRIILIDSSEKDEHVIKYVTTERCGYYPVYYVGTLKDTLRISKRKISGYDDEYEYESEKSTTWPDSTSMEILVDTSFALTYARYSLYYSDKEEKEPVDSVETFHAFPIFVFNLGKSSFWVGTFSELGYTIRQAKNEKGNWVDIEIPIRYHCGTGARRIFIEPNQVLIAKLLRYDGNFKTECRLKFVQGKHSIYSNVFIDLVDKNRFTENSKTENGICIPN